MQGSVAGMAGASDIAAERAYVTTKRRIITGEIPGGALISEVALSKDLEISRTPVHEAFLRLSTEQLLELQPRRGAFVRPMTPSEADDVLVMRHAIEATGARQVFDGGGLDAGTRTALEENLVQQREFARSGDVDRFVEADDDFHLLVVRGSGNTIAVHFYEQLRDRQQRLRHQLLRVDPGKLQAALADHEELFRCLLDGDADRYATILQGHFDRYRGAL